MDKQVLLTGGRPTGKIHLGHFFGAFKEYVNLQKNYDCFFVISDIHMLTTSATNKAISQIWDNAIEMVIDVISMGMDPNNTTFYLQSNVPYMPYYYTLIQNFIDVYKIQNTPSLLNTINEMKNNAKLNSISMGLMAYPVMEAADILLLNADVVTVGKDNVDHVEIAKNIVENINLESSFPLKSPQWITTYNNNLVGIDGKGKMSKSLNNCIYISDSYEEIKEKVMFMPWSNDSFNKNVVLRYLEVFELDEYGPNCFEQNIGKGELYCKKALLEFVGNMLTEMNEKRFYYKNNKDFVEKLILDGTEVVREISKTSLNYLKEGLGYNYKHCIW